MRNFIGIFLFIVVQAYACQSPIATSTVYYLPDAKKICGAYGRKCRKFVSEVRMQGSGKLYPNKVYRYNGRTENLGSCNTARGSRGTCLTPYVSVAADRRYYKMGDILTIPGLKGRKMILKNGKNFIHPGYLIVEDTGGAIKGRHRLDFFTDMDMQDKKNAFGYTASDRLKLYDQRNCGEQKKIAVRIKSSDTQYAIALKEIKAALTPAETQDQNQMPSPPDKNNS